MTQSEIEVDGDVIINGKAYPAIKLLEALNKLGALSFDDENAQLILNDSPIEPLYKMTRKSVFSILCYHSLAYCCPRTQECEKRDNALKMLHISPEEYSRIKDEHNSHFFKRSSVYSHSTYNETTSTHTADDVDLSSFFGTPTNESTSSQTSEKENTDEFLKEFLSGNSFETNNLWDNSINQKEARYGRKNIPPSTETGLRTFHYSVRCSRCKKLNNSDDKYCSRCGAELND